MGRGFFFGCAIAMVAGCVSTPAEVQLANFCEEDYIAFSWLESEYTAMVAGTDGTHMECEWAYSDGIVADVVTKAMVVAKASDACEAKYDVCYLYADETGITYRGQGSAEGYKRIQAFQREDPTLSCDELKWESQKLDDALAHMDVLITSQKQDAQTMAGLGAMGAMYGGVGSQMIAQNAAELSSIRDTYQQRRDLIMQQFFAMQCVAAATPEVGD